MVPPGPDRYRSNFLFILFLGHLLPEEHLAALVDQRIASYMERIAHMEHCDLERHPAPQRFVHGFGLAIYRAAAQYLKDNRDWLLSRETNPPKMVAE